MIGDWRTQHDEDHDLYFSPEIRVIRSRSMKHVGGESIGCGILVLWEI
jgi:hypothetical protein